MVTIPAPVTRKTIQPDIGVMSIVIWVKGVVALGYDQR